MGRSTRPADQGFRRTSSEEGNAMTMSSTTWVRRTVLVAAAAAVALAVVAVRPAGSAIPAGSVIGRVTYFDLIGTADITTTIRSFGWDVQLEPGQQKATFGLPQVVQDVTPSSPHIMLGLAMGKHYPNITVVLYRPSTAVRFEQLQFSSAQLRLDGQTQAGPASASPWETVSWTYQRVRQTTYDADGTTIIHTTCFDIALYKSC
jgi:hypothetical protein